MGVLLDSIWISGFQEKFQLDFQSQIPASEVIFGFAVGKWLPKLYRLDHADQYQRAQDVSYTNHTLCVVWGRLFNIFITYIFFYYLLIYFVLFIYL